MVLGRRRTGKSYLLGRYLDARRGVSYQATRLTETEQLCALSSVIGAVRGT